MSGTWRVLSSELYRLVRARGAWFALALLVLAPAARVWAARVVRSAERAERALAGRPPTGPESGDGWAPLVDGWRAGLVLAALVLLVHAARSLAADRETGVLRLAVTRSAGRAALVLGRAVLAPLLVLGAVVASGLGAWLVARAGFDFGPLVEDGYELISAAELRSELTTSIGVALPALLALYAFGLLVSVTSRSAAGAVALALALFFAFDLFKELLGDDLYYVFAAYAPSLVDTSPVSEMSGVARGFSDAGFPAGLMRLGWIVSLGEAVLLIALACLALRRKPL